MTDSSFSQSVLEDALHTLTTGRTVPGVVGCVLRNGELVAAAASGTSDARRQRWMRPETTFDMASQTKLLTCVAIVHLTQLGAVHLQDVVTDLLDPRSFKDPVTAASVTLDDLLRHQGGFGHLTRSTAALRPLHASGLSLIRRKAGSVVVSKDGPLGFDYAPGCGSQYSNVGYALLAAVVERVTQMDFAAAIQSLVLDPLEMTDTHLGPMVAEAHRHRAAGKLGVDFFPRWKGIAGGVTTVVDLGRLMAPYTTSPEGASSALAEALSGSVSGISVGNVLNGHTVGWRLQRSATSNLLHQAGSRPGLSVKAILDRDRGVGCVLMANRTSRLALHAAAEHVVAELARDLPGTTNSLVPRPVLPGTYKMEKRPWQAPISWLEFGGHLDITRNSRTFVVRTGRGDREEISVRDGVFGFCREEAWIPLEFTYDHAQSKVRLGGPYTGIELNKV